MTCKNCGYGNKLGVRYCQRCGQYIEPKRTLAQEVKSWDFITGWQSLVNVFLLSAA